MNLADIIIKTWILISMIIGLYIGYKENKED